MSELIKPIAQKKRLRFTEFGDVTHFTRVGSDRAGTKPLPQIRLKLTLVLPFQPEADCVPSFTFLLTTPKGISQVVKEFCTTDTPLKYITRVIPTSK